MTNRKTETFTLKGVLTEGKDCLIIREHNPIKIIVIGELVETTINKFVDKEVKLCITVEIEEVES
jgi:hypothetical protein